MSVCGPTDNIEFLVVVSKSKHTVLKGNLNGFEKY